jgi:hypothetical protein
MDERRLLERAPASHGAFYLPCCWETLAVTAARDHCCAVLPHHHKGRTPARSPSRGGDFSAQSIVQVRPLRVQRELLGTKIECSERSESPDRCPTIPKSVPPR